MKKGFSKGFTLIELLVVIIIMGILAAIAVPKLFGIIAKSKFSEVPPAAGTYIKLQDAYLNAYNELGNWSRLGYAAPGTNGRTKFFFYSQGELSEETTKVTELGEDGKIGWKTTNIKALHNCMAGSLWSVTVVPIDESHVEYKSEVNSENCIGLASAWGNVSNKQTAGKTELSPSDVGYTMTMGTPQKGGWSLSGGGVNHNVDKSQYATNNPDREDGLYVLEGNSTYTFTIEVDAKDANGKEIWPGDSYMQTAVRVYTDPEATGNAAIVCGSVKEENKAEKDPEAYNKGWVDGNGNGYNTGSGQDKGYTAEATIKREGDKYVTTVTITTGSEGGYFGANFLAVGNGGYDSNGGIRRTATQAAIEKATLSLTKTGGTSSK